MKKKLAIAILDWGNGHLTRTCAMLREDGYEAEYDFYFFVNEQQWLFISALSWKTNITNIPLLGYRFWINPNTGLMQYFVQLPKMTWTITHEHKLLKRAQKEFNFDLIISDHRYGFFHSNAPSVFITHQLRLAAPKGLELVNKFHTKLLDNFSEVYCLDETDQTKKLAGRLSTPVNEKLKVIYKGHYSHFKTFKTPHSKINITSNQILVILSGPEPQRSIFELELCRHLSKFTSNYRFVMVNTKHERVSETMTFYGQLGSELLGQLISESAGVISRMGYSTLMDLKIAQKKGLLIPTPYQYEQEYLAQYHLKSTWIRSFKQADEISATDLAWLTT